MDALRQIRILIPPFFFFAVLISAPFASYDIKEIRLYTQDLGLDGWKILAFLLGLIGVASLPAGFLLSTLTSLVLDLWARSKFSKKSVYQSRVNEKLVRRLRSKLLGQNIQKKLKPDAVLDTLVTFEHGILKNIAPGTHEWLARTYSWQVISWYSISALLTSMVFVYFTLPSSPSAQWWWTISLITMLLYLGAKMSSRDNTDVNELQMKFWLDSREKFYQFHCENVDKADNDVPSMKMDSSLRWKDKHAYL